MKPHRTSHELAHSTGLPKPPSYNLECPRVTPIQVTLVIGPPAKASHHDTHLKLCKNPSRVARQNLVPDRLVDISHR